MRGTVGYVVQEVDEWANVWNCKDGATYDTSNGRDMQGCKQEL